MKKILKLLLKHLEKIVLAFFLVVFIVMTSFQVSSLKDVQTTIGTAQNEAADLAKSAGRLKVDKIDESIFDLQVAIKEPWLPPFTLGKWETYRDNGDRRIFGPHRNPPSVLSEDYRIYLEDYGPGSLFDPPMYVYPLDYKAAPAQNDLLGFESVYAFYNPYNLDIPQKKIEVDPRTPGTGNNNGGTEPTPTTTAVEAPAKLVRIGRIRDPYLPLSLSSVMQDDPNDANTWIATFATLDARGQRRQVIVNSGQAIGTTGYTLRGISVATRNVDGINRQVFTAEIAGADGGVLNAVQGQRVLDPNGQYSFQLYYFPKNGFISAKYYGNGETITLTNGTRSESYQLKTQGKSLSLVETATGTEYPIAVYNRNEHRQWYMKNSANR